MTKIIKLLSVFLLALLVLLPSCYRIEEMSDFNEIHTLDILSFTSETVDIGGLQRPMQLGGADIVDGSVIYIDIVFGEHLFPLRFFANPIIQGEIDRIVGVDFSEEQVFETRDCEIRFYVMAISGLSRVYTIRPRIIPLDQNAAIRDFFQILSVEPAMIISEQGAISGDTLRIFSVGGNGPVTIVPKFFTIADSAIFGETTSPNNIVQTFTNGEMPLSFNTPDDIHQLRVLSQSGVETVWHIMMHHSPTVSGPGHRTDINDGAVSGASQTENFTVMSIVMNNDTEQILLAIREDFDGDPEFPLELNMSFNFPSGVHIVGSSNATNAANTVSSANSARFVFEGWDDVHSLYLLDAETRTSRHWRVNLMEWLSPANMVERFTFDYTASTVSFLDENDNEQLGPAAIINLVETEFVPMGPSVGHIYLYLTTVNDARVDMPDNWRLALSNVQVDASERATVGQLPNFVWEGNDSWQTPLSFDVTAQDGSVRTWHVQGRVRDTSTAAELTNLTILDYFPNFAEFDPHNPVIIDAENSTVTLVLTQDRGVYLPLRVYFWAEVSPNARVMSQNSGTEPLIFHHDSDTQIITVRAGDRETTRDWTVRLQHPVRSTEAELVSFSVSTITGGNFILDGYTVNHQTREIRVRLSTGPRTGALPQNSRITPPSVTYTMTISDWANVTVPESGTFTFNTFRTRQTFTITAEDRTTTSNWTVRLIYEPQLFNGNLDQWQGNNNPEGWATANQAAVGTTRIAGNPASGGAAQMVTGETMGTLASASLFLGTFTFNVTAGLTDPISLTNFGTPFATSGHIRGIRVDVMYQPGGNGIIPGGHGQELGALVMQLLKPRPGFESANWVYHGHHITTGLPHVNNTGMRVAHNHTVFGNSPGTAWNGLPITVVSPTEWTTIDILFDDFPDGVMPDFTHIHIVFSASARGEMFRGIQGSNLRIDNVRILYREED